MCDADRAVYEATRQQQKLAKQRLAKEELAALAKNSSKKEKAKERM
jgi:hypothetical protein